MPQRSLIASRRSPPKRCRLRVRRASEQILLPETGLDLASGYAPVNVTANETWVVSSELSFPKDRQDENNRVLLAKIIWSRP